MLELLALTKVVAEVPKVRLTLSPTLRLPVPLLKSTVPTTPPTAAPPLVPFNSTVPLPLNLSVLA